MDIITTLFVGLIILIWLRLFIIFVLVLSDVRKCRLRNPTTHSEQKLDGVTVLIPAYQEEKTLDKTLASAEQLVIAGASLVMVDDGSTDQTNHKFKNLIEKTGKGTLIQQKENQGKPNALNSGLEKVNTVFVLTLDADTSVEVEAVRAATVKLREAPQRDATVVAFDVSVKPSTHLFRELQGLEYDGSLNFERRGQATIAAVSVAPGAASLWVTADLRAIGGFSGATVTEDVDATLKLAAMGKRAIHCPQARAFTGTPMTFSQLMVQRRRWCLGHYQGIARHLSSLGKDTVFTLLTYPNFFLLSAFMPLMLLLSLITLYAEPGTWKNMLGSLTIFWIITVYMQRWIALKLAERKITPLAFLIEPFSTLFFHICAMILATQTLLKKFFGMDSDVWKGRKR